MKKSEQTPIKFKTKESETVLQKNDIQAIITRGYNQLNAACYILLKIKDSKLAKQYFNWLLKSKKITTADIPGENLLGTDPEYAVNIAFTSSGLKKLQMPTDVLKSFSREFLEGISYVDEKIQVEERSILLGDTGKNDPRNWDWGNLEDGKTVDCLLMLFAPEKKLLENLKQAVYDNQKQNAFTEVYLLETYEYKKGDRKEHFGFTDGLSQPFVKSFSDKSGNKKFRNILEEEVEAGEFILGYKNAFGHYSRSPYIEDPNNATELDPLPNHKDKKDLGKNGTYLVFRQIEQHVEDFWNFHYKNSKETAATPLEKAVKLASKMIGRWPNGLPLVTHPFPSCPMNEDFNNFKYNAQDKYGINCPIGAHIRRTNPRDQVHGGRNPENSLEVSGKHRMLRRGRIYGEPLDDKMDINNMIEKAQNAPVNSKRGLHFICLVSDISRQFEFVQSVWANTSTFGDLCNEVDQLIAPRPTNLQPQCNEFTTPQKIIRNRYTNVPEFTTVVGGAYFFLPGIKALKYIMNNSGKNVKPYLLNQGNGNSNEKKSGKCPMDNVNRESRKIIAYIRNILKEKYGKDRPLRIFHAKSIGLVEARIEVKEELDAYLRVGLFKVPKTYKAWIRFSNSSSTPGPDYEKGLKGMAIKVLDVQSEQFIDEDIEGKTQDIILINAHNFVPGTGALAFDGVKVILGKLWERIVSFLHVISISPAGVIAFLKSTGVSPNILEEVYYSATPYAFGNKAIKWRARPLKTITSIMPDEPTSDFLRQRLIDDLSCNAKEENSFELSIQFQENDATEPIDNSGVIWRTDFIPVATIKIPKQNFNTEERLCKDAKMSFSPGHAMIEHRPLGSVNMVRRKVYETLAKERLNHR